MSKSNTSQEMKIYTEYDAQRRAEEIAGGMLQSCIDRLEALTQQTIILTRRNMDLHDHILKTRENSDRLLHAVIYYEETYNRLTDDMKAKFREIGKAVINDYKLPYKD